MGKKINKAVKGVVKSVGKVVKGGIDTTLGAVGMGKEPKAKIVEAPAAQQASAPAAVVEAPKAEAESDESAQTESDRKKARSGGKKSLSVSRSSGGGINI